MFTRLRQRFTRRIERAQFSAIQLVSIKRSYLEKRDKNRFRELVDIPKDIQLSDEQVTAATSHARETLVVAGAGSGKTFVLVGRAKYLVNSQRAEAKAVLMLAYNKDAAEELSTRTKASDIDVTARTFHGFGNSVIKQEGERTGVAFGDDGEIASFLTKVMEKELDEVAKNELATYFWREMVPTRPYKDFKDLNEYAAYVRATIPRTLRDETVKSHGEWLIANFLFANKIDYAYEELYDVGTARERHAPDFVVWQKGKPRVWIEYFGTDRQGGVAPGISAAAYSEGIAWKKNVHQTNKTVLIDLYYYELLEDRLLDKLESSLRAFGYELNPRTPKEILEQANAIGYQSRFLHICEQFLGHVRAKRLGTSEVAALALDSRDKAFVEVFNYFLHAYEEELKRKKLPDYAELIHGAADRIASGEYPFNYTHVLVDEFQDISADRSRLLKTMQAAKLKLELTCVGDDWQSIYRFSGSDVSIMREASKPKRHRKRIDLTNTYRLPQHIADISREFVLRNPLQLEKKVNSQSDLGIEGEVIFHWDTEQGQHHENLELVIGRIGGAAQDPTLSLKILSRYTNNLPKRKFVEELWEGPVTVSSIHGAKGLEADYVIVMDLVQDFRGFPSTIEDDPVMRLVMPDKDLHEHGEERRLFYVALTRALREVHLISPISAPSLFATEMLDRKQGKHIGVDPTKNSKCPVCKVGRILVSANKRGSYCSNIPLCDFRAPKCAECEKPMVMTGNKTGRFICPEHPQMAHRDCHMCDWGVLIPRINSYTNQEFFSCHTWAKTRCKGVRN
jgi:DNA helicase-4